MIKQEYNHNYFNTMQNQYLIKVFNSVKAKQHFIIDIVEAINEEQAEEININKVYFFDSAKKRILGKCKKATVIHKI